jgi:catechol 2,3-dioxygenase-like lactoylglutathione lyase family enzyme
MQIDRLAFVAFPVADLERSREFYAASIGARIVTEGENFIDFDLGGTIVRSYIHTGDYRRQHSGLQFAVSNVEEAVEELKLAGVIPRSGLRTEPWGGKVCTLSDPDGNLFDLLDASYLAMPANKP